MSDRYVVHRITMADCRRSFAIWNVYDRTIARPHNPRLPDGLATGTSAGAVSIGWPTRYAAELEAQRLDPKWSD